MPVSFTESYARAKYARLLIFAPQPLVAHAPVETLAEAVLHRLSWRNEMPDDPCCPAQIGRELNVRYVLAGSIQRSDKRMRVSVQLIEASSGNHLWAKRFDEPLADLFDMQDEIVARLAKTLDTQLVAAAARRARSAPNPDSMDLFFQGLAWYFKGITPDSLATARRFFDRALALDPANFRALVRPPHWKQYTQYGVGVDPVWWTPLKLIFEVSDAPLPNRLSAGVPATDGRSCAIRTHARRAGA
jgi:hypothetical protein